MAKRVRFHATVDEITLHTLHRLGDEKGEMPVGRVVDFLAGYYRKTQKMDENELAEHIAEKVVQKLKGDMKNISDG